MRVLLVGGPYAGREMEINSDVLDVADIEVLRDRTTLRPPAFDVPIANEPIPVIRYTLRRIVGQKEEIVFMAPDTVSDIKALAMTFAAYRDHQSK